MKLKDYSQISLDELAIYGAEDSLYTRKLAIIVRKELENTRGWGIDAAR